MAGNYIWNYGGEFEDPTMEAVVRAGDARYAAAQAPSQPISAFAGNPFFSGENMRHTMPVPIPGVTGAAGAAAAGVPQPVGGGVAGSGLLDPTEFNLSIKDKLSGKKPGGEETQPKSMGLFSGLGSLPEGVRMAVARLGGNRGGIGSGVPTGGGMAEGQAQSNADSPMMGDAIRMLMQKRFGGR